MAETQVQEKPAPAVADNNLAKETTEFNWREHYDDDYIKARGIIAEFDPGTIYLRALNQRELVVLTKDRFNTAAAQKFSKLLPRAEEKLKADKDGYRKVPAPGQIVIVTAEGWPNSEPFQVKALNTKKHPIGFIEVNEMLDADGNAVVLEKLAGLTKASLPQTGKKADSNGK